MNKIFILLIATGLVVGCSPDNTEDITEIKSQLEFLKNQLTKIDNRKELEALKNEVRQLESQVFLIEGDTELKLDSLKTRLTQVNDRITEDVYGELYWLQDQLKLKDNKRKEIKKELDILIGKEVTLRAVLFGDKKRHIEKILKEISDRDYNYLSYWSTTYTRIQLNELEFDIMWLGWLSDNSAHQSWHDKFLKEWKETSRKFEQKYLNDRLTYFVEGLEDNDAKNLKGIIGWIKKDLNYYGKYEDEGFNEHFETRIGIDFVKRYVSSLKPLLKRYQEKLKSVE